MATGLENYKLKNDFEKLKNAVIEFTPDNDGLINAIKGLSPKNNLLINALVAHWKQREVPTLSEKDIVKQNLDYRSEPGRARDLAAVGLDPNDLVNEKQWIIKNNDGWYGWIPENQAYTDRPLIYGGELDYSKTFERKVIKYQVSGTINLNRTMRKFLETFNSMGMTDEQICEILLELCKKHVPHQYSSLARHTSNAGKLWLELASSLNNDVEESKVRKAICGISRKVGEPINLALFDIKSLYDQLLDLTHPGLDPEEHDMKATKHACKCIEFLVSKGIKTLFENYQRDKVIHDEKINLVEMVNMITQQENLKDEYKITQTMYLPPACSNLDIQPDVRVSSEQILIMKNEAWMNKKNERKGGEYRAPRTRSNSSGYNRREDDYNKDRQENRRYSRGDRSPRHNNDKPYFDRNYSRERRGSSQSRGNQPRREHRQRSGDKYRSYGSDRDNQEVSPYRGRDRRGSSPYSSGRRDQGNSYNRPERYRRESRSPGPRYDNAGRNDRQSSGTRYNNDGRNDRQGFGRDRRMSGGQRRGDSREPPARGGQPQQRQRSASGERGEENIKCRRCGGMGHKADRCEMFPFWRGKPCECGLLHRRRDCNSSPGVFLTEMETEDRRQDGRIDAPHLYIN